MAKNFLTLQNGNNSKAVFFEYQVKIVSAPDDRLTQREEVLAASFDESFMIQAQKLTTNLYAVIGARQDLIKSIYTSSSPAQITTLVPYGMAIRAFLANQGVDFEKILIFVDPIDTNILVTIIDGLNFTAPRWLDQEHLSAEIKRTLQNYYTDRPEAQNKDVQVLSAKDFPVDSPSLEGLRVAKFPIHFYLPGQILKQKQMKAAGQQLKLMGLISLILILGGGLLGAAWFYKHQQNIMVLQLQQQQQELIQELQQANRGAVMVLLAQEHHLDYAAYYTQFLNLIPEDYTLKNLIFSRMPNLTWSIDGIIYPANLYGPIRPFKGRESFRGAEVTEVEVNQMLGQQIHLSDLST